MSHTDRALVLARGLGSRMRKDDPGVQLTADQQRAAAAGLKALMPIDGRPFLDYVLANLVAAGYDRACLVIGPDHHEVRRYYEALPKRKLSIDFAIQATPRGTADAVRAAESFCGSDPFLMINSDNLYPTDAVRRLRDLPGNGLALFSRDVPFAMLYLLAPGTQRFSLCGAAGLSRDGPVSPSTVELGGEHDAHVVASALRTVLTSESLQVIDALPSRWPLVPPGPWRDPPHAAVAVPIRSNVAPSSRASLWPG